MGLTKSLIKTKIEIHFKTRRDLISGVSPNYPFMKKSNKRNCFRILCTKTELCTKEEDTYGC